LTKVNLYDKIRKVENKEGKKSFEDKIICLQNSFPPQQGRPKGGERGERRQKGVWPHKKRLQKHLKMLVKKDGNFTLSILL
jgi:hypothetical protein